MSYTSDDIASSVNWVGPVGSFKGPCYLCNYFRHGLKQCPNILKEFKGRY